MAKETGKEFNLVEASAGAGARYGLTDAQSLDVAETIFANIKNHLADGHRVHLTEFAMFEVVTGNVHDKATGGKKQVRLPKARFSKTWKKELNA